jgi:prepilin-type N-terminal cleavage/methylation domain-containing protein
MPRPCLSSRYALRKGLTLVELMVAIFVMLIAMEGFTFLFVRTWDTNKFILEEGLASAAASRATNKIVVELRGIRQADNGDYPIESGDDFDLEVYGDIDNDGTVERLHYYLDQTNDQLKVGITNPNTGTTPVSYPAGDEETRVLTNYVVNESDNPVFYYYNRNYPGDTTNNPLSTPVSPGNVQLIRVHLLVNIDPVHAPNNVNIESFVDLRNLEIAD